MFCQECGTKNQDNAKFCFNCGAKLCDLDGSIAEKESKDGEEFSIIQRRYVEKICKEVFSRYYQGKEIENADYYENAKLYEMSAKQVDYVINKLLTVSQKVYDYIGIEVKQLGDFCIPEKIISSIYEYGQDIGLPESSIEKIIEKYVTEHKLNEKQEMYDSLFNSYFSDYIEEDDKEDENEKDYLSELTPKEQAEVTERFNTNIEKINQLIELEYSKTDKLDLEEKQMFAILELVRKCGIVENEDIVAILLKYQDEHGITAEKTRQEVVKFRSIVDQAYSIDIHLFGESRTVEGHLILKNLICSNFNNQANTLRQQWGKINSKEDSAISDMAYYLVKYGSNILEQLETLDRTLPSLQVLRYFEVIQTYVIEKLSDICAVNTACQNIDANTDLQMLYRRARKAYRSQWIGGGFGFSGALKGAVSAGVLNMGSGAIHSVVNAVGNANTRHKANKQKIALINEIKKGVPEEIINLTKELGNSIILYIDEVYPNFSLAKNSGKYQEIYTKFLNASGKEKEVLAVSLLEQNPCNEKCYEEILVAFPNVKTRKALLEIGKSLGVENLSDLLNDLAGREYEKYKQRTDVNAIESMYNWFNIMFDDALTAEGRRDTFKFELGNQIKKFTGNDLKNFVDSLLEYNGEIPNQELKEEYNKRVNEIIVQNKKICDNINELDMSKVEKTIDDLIILKRIATSQDQDIVNSMTKQFAQFKIKSLEAKMNVRNVEDVCKTQADIKAIQEKYGYLEPGFFEKILYYDIDAEISKSSTKEELTELKKIILEIEEAAHIDLKMAGEKVEQLIEEKIRQEKTVYDYYFDEGELIQKRKPEILQQNEGVLYNTAQEAETIRKKVDKIKSIYEDCAVFSYDSVNQAITSIRLINKETGFGDSILNLLNRQLQRLDVERRTVLGTLYETLEEAEAEREKVVGDKKFNSKEEADKERERLRIEKEIEEQEMNIIWNWEAQKFSPIDILANLLSGRFTSKRAQNKIREYNNKVFNIYSSLKSKNVSLELAKLRTKQGVCMLGGIIAILIGIGPFFALGWIGKIIIFCIVAFPWGLMMQAREDAESYKKEEKILKYIERIFYINAGKLYLKEGKRQILMRSDTKLPQPFASWSNSL